MPEAGSADAVSRGGPDPRGVPGVVFGSYPDSRVENSQPAGIGRVVALGRQCAWNNLGRNVVFASRSFQPEAVFDQTSYPDDDELSQYDLDVHAILEIRGAAIVVVLNHLGLLRAFRAADLAGSGTVASLEPLWTSRFVDDVERTVAVGDRLVGSRPRREAAGGVIVSRPLTTDPGPDIDVDVGLEDWDVVTALATVSTPAGPRVAVGAVRRVGLFPVTSLDAPVWEVTVGFQPAALLWDGQLLWAAGSEPADGVDDYDWEQLHGGGFAGLDPRDGRRVVEGRFDDLAWGTGGAAVVITPDLVCGIERTGALALHSTRDGGLLARTTALASHPLGIAHATAVDDHVLYGFNRAGYELCAVSTAALDQLAREHT
ncbi:MAG TPA: hypothetical protein VI462_15125 [Acidimicrobiia bacterium]